MEQILKNLNDPSWWFTGVFFVLVGTLLTKLLFNWIPRAVLNVSTKIPTYAYRLSMRLKILMLKTVKNNRQHEVKVNWIIARYWSLETITMIYMVFSFVIFLLYPRQDDAGIKQQLVPFALFIPLYLFQWVTHFNEKVTAKVINANIAWKKRMKIGSKGD
ncbi:hypothetical protein [Pseudaeromonas paramecii]|uniref:Uncharacterized protein n=1 Tax=Pseudaeromonas paramecii TaxID=2138166 RepID=A0ABP8PZI8_9GAMM